MSRFLVSVLIVLLLAGGSAPLLALSVPELQPITVAGVLEQHDGPALPHLRISGYVLLGGPSAELLPLVGRHVTVTGMVVIGPTAFMLPAIQVKEVRAETPVSTPIVADPDLALPPRGGSRIEVPAPPVLAGTNSVLLFGRISELDGRFYLQPPNAASAPATPVVSGSVHLPALIGEVAGLVAAAEGELSGRTVYRVEQAIVLTQDLAGSIRERTNPIYVPPAGQVSVEARGRRLTLDVEPVMGNGRTMLPLRIVAEGLGATVEGDGAERVATVLTGERKVKVAIGSNQVVVSKPGAPDAQFAVDVAPIVAGGRTLVPVRVIAEGLGLQISWDAVTRTVSIQ